MAKKVAAPPRDNTPQPVTPVDEAPPPTDLIDDEDDIETEEHVRADESDPS